jgi:hypothetical protein
MRRTSTGRNAWRGLAAALALAAAAGCGDGAGNAQKAVSRSAATSDGATCNPNGAHPQHAFAACTTCHLCRGVVEFDPAGAAVAAGLAAPAFDPATKTCSSVACHTVRPGTFTYFTIDGSGEPVEVTVSYGGGAARPTPAWTSSGLGCTACHDNPPRNGSSGSNAWHSGYHGGQGPSGANNQCQLCHPDATSSNGVGTAITNPSLHADGSATVQASFRRTCFGCH